MSRALLEASRAVFRSASQLCVTERDGSTKLVGFFVPADEVNALGRALTAAGALRRHGEVGPEFLRLVDLVVIAAGESVRSLEAEPDPEALLGVVAMAREEWPDASPAQLARGIDWSSIRRRGETREAYAERTGR